MKFEKLDNSKTSVVESNITKEWKEMDILKRSIETRKDGEKWVFYDGPIYANAKPGIHHVFAKTLFAYLGKNFVTVFSYFPQCHLFASFNKWCLGLYLQ